MTRSLFPDRPVSPSPPAVARATEGAPRVQTANRTQVELVVCDLDARLPPDHAARAVWQFVEGLDLGAFYAAIQARDGRAGRPAIDPKILVALWLYATMDGVGSAREVDRLCRTHDAYRWLCGGVSVNYHTLADLRVQQAAALDDLLTQSVAVLLHRRVITLRRVTQDGTRVRANAGGQSFRRKTTLEACLRRARQQVRRTAQQVDGADGARAAAAQRRAAREQVERVEAALAELPAVEAVKAKARRAHATPARVSTTDPEARVMKRPDGGFRPAYNIQVATDVDSRAVVGVGVTNVGSDRACLLPMLTQITQRTGRLPEAALVDQGYVSHAAVDQVAALGVTLYAPVRQPQRAARGTTPRPSDSPAVRAWRARMATPAAQQLYRQRAATAEWVNADLRTHRTLGTLGVRGLRKVHCWVMWAALAHNMLRTMQIVPHLMT